MKEREEHFLDEANRYKELYKACKWWEFKKRREYYVEWKAYLKAFIKYVSR